MKKFKDQTVNGILLASPTPDDSGDYMCVAENSAGRIEYKFTINVIRKSIKIYYFTILSIQNVTHTPQKSLFYLL